MTHFLGMEISQSYLVDQELLPLLEDVHEMHIRVHIFVNSFCLKNNISL